MGKWPLPLRVPVCLIPETGLLWTDLHERLPEWTRFCCEHACPPQPEGSDAPALCLAAWLFLGYISWLPFRILLTFTWACISLPDSDLLVVLLCFIYL